MKKYHSYQPPAHKRYNEDKDIALVAAGAVMGMFDMMKVMTNAIVHMANKPTHVTTINKTYNITTHNITTHNHYYGGQMRK